MTAPIRRLIVTARHKTNEDWILGLGLVPVDGEVFDMSTVAAQFTLYKMDGPDSLPAEISFNDDITYDVPNKTIRIFKPVAFFAEFTKPSRYKGDVVVQVGDPEVQIVTHEITVDIVPGAPQWEA